MGNAVSTEYVGLKNRPFSFDDFLDFLLTEPGFHIVFHVHHFEIDLVEDRLGSVLFVQNRRNAPPHHIVGAGFLAWRLLRVLTGMAGLLAPLLAHLLALALDRKS